MSSQQFDLIVIGTGIASLPARRCVKEGWKVALVDSRPPGGTCALRGCTPKKMLRTGALVLDFLHRMDGHGVDVTQAPRPNWPGLVAFKDSYTDPIPGNNKGIYEKMGIQFFPGHASFVDEHTVAVKNGGDPVELQGRKFVLATGARPSPLEFPGADLAITSDDFIHLKQLPPRIVFIGGGFISMEFAHLAARYGSHCTVVHPRERPLSPFDPELVDLLVAASSKEENLEYLADSRVSEIREVKGVYTVVARSESGASREIEADLVVHGAGRIPNLEGLALDVAGVPHTGRGVTVNEYLQSTGNPDVYAAGDCADTGRPHLSLVASVEGQAVARNLLEGNVATVRGDELTSVAFTLPAIASCGLGEKEARERGLDVEVKFMETTRWFTNRHVNEPAAGFKIIHEKGTDRLLGAHFLGHHCEEFINLFSLAIHHGMKRSDMKGVLYAHPSAASDLARILG
ncbi:MAG: NAD(P)/FAD-dependent oxidoreductase [Candidatus Sumerlaeia bacterium]|nr:NAD(P)/FAD-dependent oxidoreductase [Candidatus Sumerlaeia bacterium]